MNEEPDMGAWLRGAACGVAAVTIWGAWMPVTRLGVAGALGPADLAAVRFATAGLLLAPIVLRRGLALDRLGLSGLLLLVAGAGAPYALLAASGLRFAPAAHAGALVPGVMLLFVALLASLTPGERVSPGRMAGFALILLGAAAVAGPELLVPGRVSLGHGVFLAAALLWAVFTVVMRRARLDPLHATALVATGSLVGFLPVYLAAGGGGAILAAPLVEVAFQAFWQGVMATIVSVFLFGRAVAALGPSRGAAFGALAPAIAALLAIPLLGETPEPRVWLEIALVCAGVWRASGGPAPVSGRWLAGWRRRRTGPAPQRRPLLRGRAPAPDRPRRRRASARRRLRAAT